jgi:hypothetical protein
VLFAHLQLIPRSHVSQTFCIAVWMDQSFPAVELFLIKRLTYVV